MKTCTIGKTAVVVVLLAVMAQGALAAVPAPPPIQQDIPDKTMVSKGGVLYPITGDSSQTRFQTPKNARELFPPGTLVGVLPEDCVSASGGSVGAYYRCDHDFALKQVEYNGRKVYEVIEKP